MRWCKLLLGVYCAVAAQLAQATPEAAPERFTNVARIVAFGDVHGDFDAMVELLRYVEVIDADNAWIADDTHLVSLGDLLDRGDHSRRAMDLLMSLEEQALAAGGRVHVVLGNHELMNLTGDLRYVAPGEYAAFAADETPELRSAGLELLAAAREQREAQAAGTGGDDSADDAPAEIDEADYPPGFFAHRQAFSPDGRYGRWLLGLPTMVVVNDHAFVHGGYPAWLNEYTLTAINEQVRSDLSRLLSAGAELRAAGVLPPFGDLLNPEHAPAGESDFTWLTQSPLLGERGPHWYRGTALCHPLIEAPTVDATLEHFAVATLVMGHSPTSNRKVQARFDGKAILADTGMLSSYYRGEPAALIVEAGATRVVYPREEQTARDIPPPPSDVRLSLDVTELTEFMEGIEGADEAVSFRGFPFQPRFEPGNKRAAAAHAAAFRLDRLLGIGMSVPAIASRIDGRNGTLLLLPENGLTETERVQQQIFRPRWCDPVLDYQLMYAFDALTKNDARTGESMLYDRNSWALNLLLGDGAFGTSKSLPAYLAQVRATLPQGLAQRLEALDLDTLSENLGEFLSQRQIRAIDARRRILLESWPVEG